MTGEQRQPLYGGEAGMDGLHPTNKGLQGEAQLDAGQLGAQTEVDAVAEGQVLGGIEAAG